MMNIIKRVANLEKSLAAHQKTVGRIIVQESDADKAGELWLACNPGLPLPDMLIVRIIISSKIWT